MENLADIAVFVQVVKANSFTAAARDLGLSRSVVSKYISRLEQNLGVRLLNRTTRRLRLTEAGVRFYEQSRSALGQLEDAEGEGDEIVVAFRLEATDLSGVPIGSTSPGAEFFLNAWLRDKRTDAPQAGVFAAWLDVLYDDSLVQPVLTGENRHGFDIEFGPDGSLYVLELSKNGLLTGDFTGALIRVAPDGSRTELGAGELFAPGGVAFGPDGMLYVTNNSILPGLGQVLRIQP